MTDPTGPSCQADDRTVETAADRMSSGEYIVAALERVSEGDSLSLINSFEPEPLYGVLEERGFVYEVAQPVPDEWHVRITTA